MLSVLKNGWLFLPSGILVLLLALLFLVLSLFDFEDLFVGLPA